MHCDFLTCVFKVCIVLLYGYFLHNNYQVLALDMSRLRRLPRSLVLSPHLDKAVG